MYSLRARMIIAFVVPTAAIVIVLVAVAYLAARQGMEEELARRLEAVGQVMAADMSDGIDAAQISRLDASMPRVRSRLVQRLEGVRQATQVRRIFIFDDQARSLVDTDAETGFGETLYRIEADRRQWRASLEEQQTTTGTLFRTDDGQFHKRAYVPILLEGQTVAVIGVEASATYFDLLTGYATVLTILGVLGIALVLLIGLWFSRILVRPVDVLVAAAGRVARGDLQTPASTVEDRKRAGTGELEFLMTSFEEMRRSIVERDGQMQMMLAGIAHEVRNPLGGMELFCGLLKEDLRDAPNVDDRQTKVEMVERIEREVAYLGGIVSDFLAFARPEEMDLEKMKAGDFLEEISQVVAGDVAEAGCDLKVEIDDEDLEITVDRARMRRGVINVIRNGWQACKPGASIVVRCRPLGSDRLIEVIDEGSGIAVDEMEKLYTPFFTTREKGSGLGLSLTRQIVEDHGGSLEVESQVGQGTTVRFVLPFDERAESRAVAGRGEEVAAAVPEGWLG